jgi:hypothetical protein
MTTKINHNILFLDSLNRVLCTKKVNRTQESQVQDGNHPGDTLGDILGLIVELVVDSKK